MHEPRWANGPQRLDLLTAPVDMAAAKQWAAQNGMGSGFATVFGGLIGVGLGAIIGIFFGTLTGNLTDGSVVGVIVTFVIICGGIVGGVFVGRGISARSTAARFRRASFAHANDMEYRATHNGQYSGLIFDVGRSNGSTDAIRTTTGRPVEFANYSYTTGSGKNQTTHHWSYVAVRMDNVLPNIVLDAVGNNGIFGSNLPIGLSKDQRLSLEGDFDRFFQLYAPVGYERDALYLFSPDIMIRFMSTASELDVEIVDDWVFFYSKRQLSSLDPGTWVWLYQVIDTFLAKTEQWERWRDERLNAEASAPTHHAQGGVGGAVGLSMAAAGINSPRGMAPDNPYLGQRGVADQGKRLKRSFSWVTIVGVAAWIILQIVSTILKNN